ncbi:hypothetical protein Btru_026500 [Bulinus truncatus]|nr:hypothetical protein Btru_026500 [Bulinus truncatus]
MLHEGDVLYHMNQYEEASQRFQHALHLNASLLEAYLPLENCYLKLGKLGAAQALQTRCRSMFTARECATTRKITRV